MLGRRGKASCGLMPTDKHIFLVVPIHSKMALYSYRTGAEIVSAPEIVVVLNNATYKVQNRLALEAVRNARDILLGDVLIEGTSHGPPRHVPAPLSELFFLK